MVSGTLSSPSRGTFHLSLTVLVRYRSLEVFSLGEWSPQLPTKLHVFRGTQDSGPVQICHHYGTLTPCGRAFQRVRVPCVIFVTCPTTPERLSTPWFGLLPFRSPLLRESRLISSRRATEMFQFTRFPLIGLCVQPSVSRHHSGWVAPFGFSRFFACMQLPLNVSPVSASFFGFKRQGIHLVLFLACSHFLSAFSSASTPAAVHASAKLKKCPIQLVRCTVRDEPQPLESGNQSETRSHHILSLLLFPV